MEGARQPARRPAGQPACYFASQPAQLVTRPAGQPGQPGQPSQPSRPSQRELAVRPGNQCCPGTTNSSGKTFACPSAYAGFNGCEQK
eukprot:16427349-Heterocapsa_arctica.AAC.1